jgi:hypothetical protein
MPEEPGPDQQAPDDAPSENEQSPTPPLSPRKGPLRGSGSALGMAGQGGGAAELLRRAKLAAEATRRVAEERRPEAEHAAREVADRAKRVADAARPEVERLARQARAAAEAARPHVERAAQDAAAFAREHEDELRAAATRAARMAAPYPLRPMINALEDAADAEGHKQSPSEDNEQEKPAAP